MKFDSGLRPAIAVLASVIAIEVLLLAVPVADPYPSIDRVNKFLPTWNYWANFAQFPPTEALFETGKLSGVSTTSVPYSVNSFGFLFDETQAFDKAPGETRVAVIGGSTVECLALRASHRWPQILQDLLTQSGKGGRVTVHNLGVSGQDTRTHMATMAQLAAKMKLDFVIFLLGANDLFRAKAMSNPLLVDSAFMTVNPGSASLSARLKWLATRSQIIRRLSDFSQRRVDQRPYFAEAAEQANSLPPVGEAPTIATAALGDYESNLKTLAGIAATNGIQPIFVTQPMLWKDGMTEAERAVDWLGVYVREGQHLRLPGKASAHLLGQLNDRLMQACSSNNWNCIDLAKQVPRTLEYFYDSVHLNEAGAALTAKIVSEHVLKSASN